MEFSTSHDKSIFYTCITFSSFSQYVGAIGNPNDSYSAWSGFRLFRFSDIPTDQTFLDACFWWDAGINRQCACLAVCSLQNINTPTRYVGSATHRTPSWQLEVLSVPGLRFCGRWTTQKQKKLHSSAYSPWCFCKSEMSTNFVSVFIYIPRFQPISSGYYFSGVMCIADPISISQADVQISCQRFEPLPLSQTNPGIGIWSRGWLFHESTEFTLLTEL